MGLDMEINKDNVESVTVAKLEEKKFSITVPVSAKTSQMWAKDLIKSKTDLEENLSLVNRLIEKAKTEGVVFDE